jgi:hypothetical protein
MRSRILAFALALLIISQIAGIAFAKGPTLTPPPVSLNLYVPTGHENLAQTQASALGNLVMDIPRLYNSSWKPAIQDLISKSSQSLLGKWIDHIRVVQEHQPGNSTYALTVYIGVIMDGSETEMFQRSYLPDQALTQNLRTLNAGLGVEFSVYGPYLILQGYDSTGELFSQTDSYFRNFGTVSSHAAQSLTSELPGKDFSWLLISVLDERTIRLDASGPGWSLPTAYFTSMQGKVVPPTSASDPNNAVSPNMSYGDVVVGVAIIGVVILIALRLRMRAL